MKFKKISAIITSVLMAGATVGFAAAANYPAPFVDNGVANVAIVYGTGAGVSSLDMVQAGNIQTSLGSAMPSTGSTIVTDGESFKLEKTSDSFNLGDTLDELHPTLDGDEMDFLADGTYDDGDIDVGYSQEIDLSNEALTLFADPEYEDDTPTFGFWWENAEEVLSYTIDFDDDVTYDEMNGTKMPMLGGSYYVLSALSGTLELLDTAESNTINLGESKTIGDYEISIKYVDSDSVKFFVNGEVTDTLSENEEYELDDGSYIVPTDIFYQDYAGGVQGAEFSIGSGKISLVTGEEVEFNDEDVDGLEVTLTHGATGTLDSLKLTWKSDRDTFLTEENSITMPGFEAISLAFGGLTFPTASEEISVDNGDVLTISMGNYDLPLMWYDDTAASASQKFGEEDNELKLATGSYTYANMGYSSGDTVWWNDMYINGTSAQGATEVNTSTVISTALNLSENDRFLVTLIGDDLSDVDTGYYEVNLIDIDDSDTWTIEFTDLIGSNDLVFTDEIDDTDEIGDITVTHVGFSDDNSSALFEFSESTSGTLAYNKAVSEKGLVLTFPTSITAATDGTGYLIQFQEEDKDDDLEDGVIFTATVKNTTNEKYHVSTYATTNVSKEELSDDNWLGYTIGDLASKVSFDESADENDYSIEYYGGEVIADVQVATGAVTTTSGGASALGDVLVKDSEVNTVSSKNLVIVGGSCINSAAATVLGGAYCGPAFTEATGVGANQFLIKGVQDAYTTGKLALVVAGYEAADTVNAATYLTMKDVDTSAEYIGTSATEATLVVA